MCNCRVLAAGLACFKVTAVTSEKPRETPKCCMCCMPAHLAHTAPWVAGDHSVIALKSSRGGQDPVLDPPAGSPLLLLLLPLCPSPQLACSCMLMKRL